jgi:15-cis-phytoene synthase/lycopene beta-cyclase
VLVVFGLIAFDNALAILQAFPSLFPVIPACPSPILLIQALCIPTRKYDIDRIAGIQQALIRLRAKSRSFYLASSVFEGRLRIDLILLYVHHSKPILLRVLRCPRYSFCRVADDLVDNAKSILEAESWIHRLTQYLDICYSKEPTKFRSRKSFIHAKFPPNCQAALDLLPTSYLSAAPLYDLLKGFETDLKFSSQDTPFPIHDETTLDIYGSRVAGTVAELCIELVYYHTNAHISEAQRERIIHAGGRMGVALQCVNIARDIAVDASIGRVYLPSSWLKEEELRPENIISHPGSSKAEALRQRVLDHAMALYSEARGAIQELPAAARGPMRVAVESYVEIGRVLRTPGYKVKAGRATVPKLRRLIVAWNALRQ